MPPHEEDVLLLLCCPAGHAQISPDFCRDLVCVCFFFSVCGVRGACILHTSLPNRDIIESTFLQIVARQHKLLEGVVLEHVPIKLDYLLHCLMAPSFHALKD